jgi:hypothetical protein
MGIKGVATCKVPKLVICNFLSLWMEDPRPLDRSSKYFDRTAKENRKFNRWTELKDRGPDRVHGWPPGPELVQLNFTVPKEPP